MTQNKDRIRKPQVLLYRAPWTLSSLQAQLDLLFDKLIAALVRMLAPSADEMKLDQINSKVEDRESHFLISFVIPGIFADTIRVGLDGEFLDISCRRQLHEAQSGVEDVERLIRIPTGIPISKIEAEFKEGTLLLSIPKRCKGEGAEIRVRIPNIPDEAQAISLQSMPAASAHLAG